SAVVLLSPSLFRISSPVHACAAVTSDAAVGPVGPLGRSWESSYMRMPHAQSMTDHVRMSPRTAVTTSGTRTPDRGPCSRPTDRTAPTEPDVRSQEFQARPLPRRPSTAAAPVMGSAPRLWCFKPSRLLDIVSSVDDGWISVVLGSADREFGSQLARRVIADVGAIYGVCGDHDVAIRSDRLSRSGLRRTKPPATEHTIHAQHHLSGGRPADGDDYLSRAL